ncbi:MAG: hypothetical protein CTY12_01130 [Methylotenera sp.]|nr:MAG: hypothetical protein CTY12_01130 [Methylotenera sp.]
MSLVQSKHADCRFCNLTASVSPASSADRILFEDEDYFAISSIGGFIPGWALVFPKTHMLNLSKEYTNPFFLKFASHVNQTITKEYGSCVVFEHGSTTENSATSCGVNHAHMHIVPFSKDIELLASQEVDNFLWTQANIADMPSFANGSEYLFCANAFDGLATIGLFSKITNPRSQFFRQLLAKATGFSDMYDYKRYRFEDVSVATADRLSKKFHIPLSV